MKKIVVLSLALPLVFSSCVSKKKFALLEAKQKETQDLLNSATVQLNKCLAEKEASLKQVDYLQKNNENLINSSKELTKTNDERC